MHHDSADPSGLPSPAMPLREICESLLEAAVQYWLASAAVQGRTAMIWTKEPAANRSPALTAGLPWLSAVENLRRIGRRLIWWPQGIPTLRRIGLASSRLSRQLDQHTRWFDLLRTLMLRVDPATECLCLVDDTAAVRAATRAALLLQRPVLQLQLHKSPDSFDRCGMQRWIAERTSDERPEQTDQEVDPSQETSNWKAVVSPELRIPELTRKLENEYYSEVQHVPFRDRLQFCISERLCILECHAGGNIESLIVHHLCRSQRSTLAQQGPTALEPADSEPVIQLVREAMTDRIQEVSRCSRTLVPWIVDPLWDIACPPLVPPPVRHSSPVRQLVGSTPLNSPDDWLLHWTRARPGAWPGQTTEEWLDELILGCVTADRSAFAALLRIMGDGCLKASSQGIRGGYCVVSFTEVPLHEFRQRRIFRRHRHRYDFEPWGIGIRRHVLEDCGARPVCYGDDADWQQLPEQLRPWYQKATAGDGPTNNLQEREWRIVGDLSLKAISAADICLFADTQAAADILSQQTQSMVVVVP